MGETGRAGAPHQLRGAVRNEAQALSREAAPQTLEPLPADQFQFCLRKFACQFGDAFLGLFGSALHALRSTKSHCAFSRHAS
jgi:hypothetical protein